MRARPLAPQDERILDIERGNVRGHTMKVIVLAGSHDAAELQAHMAPRLADEPSLGWRLDPGPPPAWLDDPDFDLGRHVLAGPALDEASLRAFAAKRMAERLDRSRPLWSLDVATLEGDRTALVWRIHHALADGTAAVRMLHNLMLDDRVEELAAGAPAREAPPRPSRVRTALSIPAVLHRELARRGRPSVLDREPGPRREIDWVDADLERLKRIGHEAPERATVNDVALAAVAAGLRHWLGPERGVRVKVPVSLHTPGDEEANRDSFMFVDLPLDAPDRAARLAAISRETRVRKAEHDAQSLDEFFSDLSHFSRSLERFAEGWAESPRVFTLNVSNVPGPRGPQSVLGSPLAELHFLAEVGHRHALRVSVLSAGGRVSFGLCADPDAVGGLDELAAGIREELE